jgi:hypothetical protein
MRKILAAASIAAALGAWSARADVTWWTPKQRDCPTFDTQAACVAFCTADPARCGDDTSCVSRSGPERSPC